MTETTTVDLRDRIAEIEDEMARIKREAQELGPDDSERQTLNEDYEELHNAKQDLQEAADEWGDTKFKLKANPTWGDQNRVNDLVMGDMAAEEDENPAAKMGAMKARMVQVYTVDTPDDAPQEPGLWPPAAGEFLFQQIDAITRFGDNEGGDFLLEQELDETN